ncbi:MBL fold metallo-hydrolase [Desmospora activa]|uniref:Glyoxylase-like metal-dependent hydrolase (Beta-lactamase superfamily II) n=1 Tax=Desmospora activa DSM 45169 TaxID=1121389 RepID=A0A2T4YZP6_9BACL|nr:MBL fold metallo-hydrolase [Desmospora activa]PTM52698.1 glyoxylase-like metal-dependent hydrolase (beta-lactamase superfamily II) [Desmospora activa DSM 45169]
MNVWSKQWSHQEAKVFQSTGYQYNATVLQTRDLILVVDPGLFPDDIQTIQRYVSEIADGRPLYVAFTHADWDHVMGAKGWHATPHSTPRMIGSIGMAQLTAKQERVEEGRKILRHLFYIDTPPLEFPELDVVVEKDGQTLHVGNTAITFYHAPGHTRESMMIVVDGLWVLGDYLSDIEFPFIFGDYDDYKQTLEKIDRILQHHTMEWAVPGHGSIIQSTQELMQRKEKDLQYLRQLKTIADDQQLMDMIQGYTFLYDNDLARNLHRENHRKVTNF